VLLAPRVRQLLAMVLTTTKLAAQVPPTCIPRMREEPNPTPAAADRTDCRIRMSAQDGIHRQLILTNKRTGTLVPMPIPAKRKELADGYDKNAKFSVRMLM
jgi:hypothetical protein